MLKISGLLMVVMMFALSGCASTEMAGKSATAQSGQVSTHAPAVSSPAWTTTVPYPPYHR